MREGSPVAGRDADVATFAPTRRQVAVLQLVLAPLIVGLVAVLFLVLKSITGDSGEITLLLVVVVVASLLVLFAAP